MTHRKRRTLDMLRPRRLQINYPAHTALQVLNLLLPTLTDSEIVGLALSHYAHFIAFDRPANPAATYIPKGALQDEEA